MKRAWNTKVKFMGLAAILVVILTGCGSSGYKDSYAVSAPQASYNDYGYGGNYYDEVAEEEMAWDDDYDMAEPSVSDQKAESIKDNAVKNRKLIRNASLDVETQEFDNLMDSIKKSVDALGGYIENIYHYNGSAYYSYGYRSNRNASLTIRIPEQELDGFLNTVAGIGNVTSRSENVEDVTLTYVDLESHRNSLKVEQQRLTELLEKAETVDEIITIEDRLSNVRYRLESMESQLRTYDNRIAYSTVRMNVEEVQVLTPVVEKSAWERMTEGFVDSVKDVIDGVKEFGIWLIINLPYLVIWAIVIVIAILVIRFIIRKHRANAGKAAERAQKREQKRLEKLAKKNAKKAESKPEENK